MKHSVWIIVAVAVIILLIINDAIQYCVICRIMKKRQANVKIKNPKDERYKQYR